MVAIKNNYPVVLLSLLLGLLTACSSTPVEPEPQQQPTDMTPATLNNSSWQVVDIYDNPAEAAASTLRFTAEDQVNGSTGCNNFNGKVSQEGSKIDFGMLATTRKMCEPAVSGQERVFIEALDAVTGWRKVGSQLQFTDENNQVIINLRATTSE